MQAKRKNRLKATQKGKQESDAYDTYSKTREKADDWSYTRTDLAYLYLRYGDGDELVRIWTPVTFYYLLPH